MGGGPKQGVAESQACSCLIYWWQLPLLSTFYMPGTRTQWDEHPRLIWQMLGDQSVILVRGTAGIWTLACLPLYPGPCLYLSCLCLFLGQDRKRPQAMRPSVLQVSSMLALVLPPSRQSRGRQKDKAARVGTPAKGRCGARRPAGRGQVSGQTSWGLLACWATLRKPEHIRPQEFPGPVLAQQQWEKSYEAAATLLKQQEEDACHLGPPPWAGWLLASPFPSPGL